MMWIRSAPIAQLGMGSNDAELACCDRVSPFTYRFTGWPRPPMIEQHWHR
jgi:hypothetical protein